MAALTAAILGIAGCYGQTDLATRVSETGATLNARGATNAGPAEVNFEFWKTADPGTKIETPLQVIPEGANGPFSRQVGGLAADTQYSFRLCGTDRSTGGFPVCAQTRTFITGSASVRVIGSTGPAPIGEDVNTAIDVNVASGPPGGGPLGRVSSVWRDGGPGGPPGGVALPLGSTTTDNVTCLNVEGNVAMIGYRQIPPNPDNVPIKNVLHAIVVDGGPAGSGRDRFFAAPTIEDEDPEDCTIPADVQSLTAPLRSGEASVSVVEPSN